jgi:hypothetical protein
VVAIGTAGITFAIHSYRYRFVRSDADMLAFLPSGEATVFFADAAALRHASMLNLLTGSKPVSDPEYQDFVRQTHFEYSKDLDAVAGKANSEQLFLVLRGRFDWGKLRRYAAAHGGSCTKRICKLPGTRAARWASFMLIQPDVMGLALSADSSAVEMLRPSGGSRRPQMPAEPVWVNLPASLLRNPVNLPPPMRIFAIALQSADSVTLSLARPAENRSTAFNVQLDAICRNASTADTARDQLEIQTKMLRLGLEREHQQPNPADFTGLLTAGRFQVVDKHVMGTWPVSKELLSALE